MAASPPFHSTSRVLSVLCLASICLSVIYLTPESVNKSTKRSHRRLWLTEVRKFAADGNPRVLNVHIVPHTHDDVGWLKTVEQYYLGQNNSIDTRGNVRGIITTVVQALLDNPSRTFSWVEIKFFVMWWTEQNDATKDSVRYLIANEQLIFLNGGWCMHDEAATHYMGMIDQTTLGHEFLWRELGVIPTVGWQLDPFGHSATQASLLTARAGFDALYFGRIDYQDLELRHLTQECEGLWNASRNLVNSTIFWGLTGSYEGNYGPPDGFWFDILADTEPLVGANETRLLERLRTLLEYLRIQSDRTKGNHILLTMGSDFHYSEAHFNFNNYDLLIGAIMTYQAWNRFDISMLFGGKYDRVNLFYSNPEYYTAAKHTESAKGDVEWSVKTDDFFPYADCPHCYWTGYFVSRAAFKRFERVASSFLLAARQIEAAIPTSLSRTDRPLFALEDALGVVQHHDAISGTAKQHVANDYSRRLQAGLDVASSFVANALRSAMLENETDLPDFAYCQLLNETYCEVSEHATKENGTAVYVVVYNPLALERSTIVRLPVSSAGKFEVERVGRQSSGQVSFHSSILAPLLHEDQEPKYLLMFETGYIPPVGAATFRIVVAGNFYQETDLTAWRFDPRDIDGERFVEASNGLVSVKFDQTTGMLVGISGNGVDLKVGQTWGYYTSFDSKFDHSDIPPSTGQQCSSAYIFRPSEPEQDLRVISPALGRAEFVNTSVGLEVRVVFEQPWIKQVTRVLNSQPFVEIEYTVGPVPIDDGRGKEIVTRFQTPINSHGVFYTDSNGREFLRRERNRRASWVLSSYEPVAGNYYPLNAASYIEDSESSLCLLVDRSQGGTSLIEGSLEVMVQRRTLADDGRGVGEPMNETVDGITPYPPYGNATRLGPGVVIRGVHRIMIGKGPVGASLARQLMDGVFAEPVLFVGSSPDLRPVAFRQPKFSSLRGSLPSNVMLITLSRLQRGTNDTFLVRLGHQYGSGEGEGTSSEPVQVDLTSIFPGRSVLDVREKTLTGNRDWKAYLEHRLPWTSEPATPEHFVVLDTLVELNPMDIRTFEVTLGERSIRENSVESKQL